VADELGVGDGVRVTERHGPTWRAVLEEYEPVRHDGVFLICDAIPPSYDDPTEPDDAMLDALSALLADSETRFLVLLPPGEAALDRRDSLALRLAERGSPPAVVVPRGWGEAASDRFAEALFERLLHDSPLGRGVGDASAGMLPPAVIYQPPGRRHGLDLARLLEDHRRRIEEGASTLRMFLRELQAAVPPGDPSAVWVRVQGSAELASEQLDAVKADVEEINRDRDPAGWSRLAQSIARLQRWEDELDRARHTLEAARTSGE
jgi:hypothetical protein